MSNAITAEGLAKKHENVTALDGMDLAVPCGRVPALPGPNGTGKTTTVRVLTTLMRPDAGRATVAGCDVVRDPAKLRSSIGASGRYAAVDDHLTGAENLQMVGRRYHLGAKRSKKRARELLERLDLADAAGRPARGYPGGMRRRIDLAGALVADPPVLPMDEPTTGPDPRAHSQLWEVISELVRSGSTLLLTTQYMEEADQIVVVDQGRVIARGTPDELRERVGGNRIELSVADRGQLEAARQALAWLAAGAMETDTQALRVTVPVTDGPEALRQALGALAEQGISVRDAGLRRPTMDDVYLALTGHRTSGPQRTDDTAAQVP